MGHLGRERAESVPGHGPRPQDGRDRDVGEGAASLMEGETVSIESPPCSGALLLQGDTSTW